jgi:hypothetical protein
MKLPKLRKRRVVSVGTSTLEQDGLTLLSNLKR